MTTRLFFAASLSATLVAGCVSGGAGTADVKVDICVAARLAGTSGYVAVVKTGACANGTSVLPVYNDAVSHMHVDAKPVFCGCESYQVFAVDGIPKDAFAIMADGTIERMSIAGIEPIPGGYVLWRDCAKTGAYFKCPGYVEFIRGIARTAAPGSGKSFFLRAVGGGIKP